MAELDISISNEDEEAEFLKKDRPLWPRIPSYCTVPICRSKGLICSWKDFLIHWRNTHCVTTTHFKCINCKCLFSNRDHMKSHKKRSKCNKGQNVVITEVIKKNELYVDPMGYLPYQLGSKEQRNDIKDFQRYKAKEKRRLESARRDILHPEPVEGVRHQLCRDERVVERGGALYKDTNMWDSPHKRKRVRLT